MAKERKPKPTVIQWERGGVLMVGVLIEGRWTFRCPRFPALSQFDGATDSAAAVAMLEKLAGVSDAKGA